jgi:hypothetical protein
MVYFHSGCQSSVSMLRLAISASVTRIVLGVAVLIQFATYRKTGFSRGGGDELNNREAADERLAPPRLSDVAEHAVLSSRAGEFPPRALPEPHVNLSIHTASDVRPLTCRNSQWAKRLGLARTTRANQSRAPFGCGYARGYRG